MLDIYHVSDKYIDYLRQFDTRVAYNKEGKRPYVGVVVQIENTKYYAPFTSPKPKHLQMKDAKDFMKLEKGAYGAINFNNMIPVPDSQLIKVSIDEIKDEKYRYLLNRQLDVIRRNEAVIISHAVILRDLLISDEDDLSWIDIKVKNRCCNLKILESAYNNFSL